MLVRFTQFLILIALMIAISACRGGLIIRGSGVRVNSGRSEEASDCGGMTGSGASRLSIGEPFLCGSPAREEQGCDICPLACRRAIP